MYLYIKRKEEPYLLRPTLLAGSLTLVNFKTFFFFIYLLHSQFQALHHVILLTNLVLSLPLSDRWFVT